jgi:hypothetical protein
LGRDSEKVLSSWTVWSFPEAFQQWIHPQHLEWHPSVLYRWIEDEPFRDPNSGLQMVGYHGISLAFIAIVHYVLNIDKSQGSDQTQSSNYKHGEKELDMVAHCARALTEQIDESLGMVYSQILKVPTDDLMRHDPWRPKAVYECSADGGRTEVPLGLLERGRLCVFKGDVCQRTGERTVTSDVEIAPPILGECAAVTPAGNVHR